MEEEETKGGDERNEGELKHVDKGVEGGGIGVRGVKSKEEE